MKKPQYITIGIALVALCLLWSFGKTSVPKNSIATSTDGHQTAENPQGESLLTSSFSIDSIISAATIALPSPLKQKVETLKNQIQLDKSKEQKMHEYHQLSKLWRDSAKSFLPFAWYNAEGARLENSEKNLNFAGRLFLDNLQDVDNGETRKWMALQAKDLFERSLKINPDNDSAKVGLGATYMFGGISNAPMQGIAKIREVVDKDSTNVYAQMTLATGALMSGQTDKAEERLTTVTKIDPKNIQAILLLADLLEKKGDNENAVAWYKKAVPLVSPHPEMKAELQKRINVLSKNK